MKSLPAFMELSFGFALLDGHLTVLAANSHFAALVHRDPPALLDKPLYTFLPELKNVAADKPHASLTLERPNGQTLAVDLVRAADNNKPGVMLFCRDLTQYRQLQEEKERQDKQLSLFSQMVSVLHDGIFIADAQAMTLYVNDAFLSLSGTRWEDVVGKSVYQLMAEGIVSNSATAAVIESGKPASTINVYPRGKTCLVSGTPVFTDGHLTRVICVIRDLTELNSLRDKLNQARSLTLSYKRQLKEIEARQESKDILNTRSRIMKNVFEKALKVAAVDATVLLLGETGVGKDFLAKFIHDAGERKKRGHFVKINCGAIPETLLESELFGYERGAFTGADKQGKAGLFEIAKNGTLFLDEIGEIPRALQVKLLNALQDKKIYRLGGTNVIDLQARIIAATNADLEKLIDEGLFRKDLYHRLNVVTIQIPALRERYDDILPMAMSFLEEFNGQYGRNCYFSPKTLELFLNYDWPGNIRELKNTVERLVIMSNEECILPQAFEESVGIGRSAAPGADATAASGPPGEPLRDKLRRYEEQCIREALALTANLYEAAALLRIDLSTLVRKKQRYGLYRRPFNHGR
jgi:PAS domain S-box-containing protein